MSRPPIEINQRPTTDGTQQPPKPVEGSQNVSVAGDANDEPVAPLRLVRAQVEIKAILAALKHTGWNRKQAARLLKISYRGLLYKIRRHNITAA
jgi:DNA-binding NtrC family response regulator